MTQQQQTQKPALRGRFTTCEITRRIDLTEDLWKIWLKPAQSFDFKPGQYCTIGAEGIERPYSIASSPDEAEIELFIELVPPPDGNLTPVLFDLSVGTRVDVAPSSEGVVCLQTGIQKPRDGWHRDGHRSVRIDAEEVAQRSRMECRWSN